MPEDIIAKARRTFTIEGRAILSLADQLTDDFAAVVRLIYACNGRIIFTGIGKSAIVAQKIVATLNSTGTPSVFMHAADALHGDLGMIQQGDIVVIISKSGASPEVKALVPLIKNFGNTIVAIVGNKTAYLAQQADYILDTTVQGEACPNNLAPTTSTTAQMVMGDALAVSLIELRGFADGDFAKFHPGGTLGKKLYLRVADIYLANEKPAVKQFQPLKDIIIEITKKRLGVTAVTDEHGTLLGIITDGDLRRMLEKKDDLRTIIAKDIMTLHPKTINADELAITALDMMRKSSITQLIVVDDNDRYQGIIHIHDILKEGLV